MGLLALALSSALVAAGCGITVLVEGEPVGAGAGGDSTSSSTGGGGVTSSPLGCTTICTVAPNGVDTCDCYLSCDNGAYSETKASCAPTVDLQGSHKVECVCKVGPGFTGICFEQDAQNLCNFEKGCCGKYLGK
jgi:hypothetical protein